MSAAWHRRQILAGLTALAAGAAPGLARAAAPGAAKPPAAPPRPHRIDVHHHLAPPEWLAEMASRNMSQPQWSGWNPARSIEDMDRGGVATSLVSVTTPGVEFGAVDANRRLARACNEFAARMVADHPGRFGSFAALPLLDVEGSLRELEHALDVLKAEGIGLLTNYGDKWLGDPAFEPVMQELNRRKAVVYTHPTSASCCRNVVPEIPPAMIEYGTDTTRAIARLLFTGTAARYPDIRWIFSHAGGTMPFLIERFKFQARNPTAGRHVPDGIETAVRRFWYDTAQATEAPPMLALRKLVPVSQIVFGSDYPYRGSEEQALGVRLNGVFSAAELRAIERDNALKLLPARHRA